jgi:DNA-binding MarR family transcriptional regulator
MFVIPAHAGITHSKRIFRLTKTQQRHYNHYFGKRTIRFTKEVHRMAGKNTDAEIEELVQLFEQMRHLWRPPKKAAPPPSLKALTLPQARCLMFITRHENCTMGELCKHLGVRLSTASELVDRVVVAGLAARSTDPEDRRITRLTLTRRGRNIHQKFQAMQKERIRQLTSTFSREEYREFTGALKTVIRLSDKARGEKNEEK